MVQLANTVAFDLGDFNELPHCTKNTVMEGEIRQMDDLGKRENVFSATQFQMGLHETACLSLKDNGTEAYILHTIQYLKLEQHYPITGAYRFAIPHLSSKCICDCAGGEQHCDITTYNYKNCSSGAICYRTYKPSQSSSGCFSNSKSEICCQVQIDPFKDWTFQALRLNQPDTFLVFRYRIYERVRQQWRLTTDRNIELRSQDRHRGRRKPPASAARAVTPDLRGGIPLNDVFESSLDKLGWMRWEEGRWDIRKGLMKITQAHHVNVEDCKGQKYTTTFNGEQMVVAGEEGDSENVDLGHQIQFDPWVQSVDVGSRVVKVEHAEGTNIMVALSTLSRPQIHHHSSQFSSFNGSLNLNRESNRFLNVTFQDAKGTMIGHIFSTEDRTHMDMVFSFQLDGPTTRTHEAAIPLPSSVNSSRYVCFHPASDVDGEKCKWLNYEAAPLPEYRFAHKWQTGQANCPGCNERGVDNFLENLDPRKWMDGFNSPTEILMCLFEISLSIVVCLSIVLIFTKCIIPLVRWTICIATPPSKK
ncbi:hypothetical protein L596_003132 [Steinernema carpocapsae]|uniref:Uncharacterized protein n=1 Tax=Steinernema carpocapsae TaxID=34508 RepID=A0A4U8UUG0_STECR|nr:hypothetical protein L596_003132 [Steinernema carpocapsae]